MNNKNFIVALSVSGDEAILALAIRRVIAKWCHVPVENIVPTDIGDDLHRQMSLGMFARGWDETGFLILLEEELGKPIDMKKIKLPPFGNGRFFFTKLVAPDNLGLWIQQAIPILRQHMAR